MGGGQSPPLYKAAVLIMRGRSVQCQVQEKSEGQHDAAVARKIQRASIVSSEYLALAAFKSKPLPPQTAPHLICGFQKYYVINITSPATHSENIFF